MCIMIELKAYIDVRNIVRPFGESGNRHIHIEAENRTNIDGGIRACHGVGGHLGHGLVVRHNRLVSENGPANGVKIRKWLVRPRFAMTCGSDRKQD